MSLDLIVSHISKSYKGQSVLKDCSFSFEDKGIYILMGPNGSGKSTFLRICALLEEPDEGEVTFVSRESKNKVLKNNIQLMRRLTLVLPKVGVFNTTVFQNVAYGLKIRRFEGKEIKKRVKNALETVGLHDKKNQNALTLSSGETQRLGIARAMVLTPEILLLDEPTVSLDPYSTMIIEKTITRITEQNQITIIMVTHNIFQAQRLADRVLFMFEGTIVEHGSGKEFFEKPGDVRARRFITGEMVY